MFENLPALFESLSPFSFSAFVAYFGLLLGLVIALLLWFRHLLRFNRIQKQKRKLNSEFRQLWDENQSLSERLAWLDNRETALDTMEAPIAKEAAAKLPKQQREQESSSHPHSDNHSHKHDQNSSGHGRDSKATSTTQAAGDHVAGDHVAEGGHFDRASQPGVSSELAARLEDMGIRGVDHLESLSSSERESLEAEGLSWNWGWLSNWKTGAAGLGATAAGTIGWGSRNKNDQQNHADETGEAATTDMAASSPVTPFGSKPEFKDDLTLLDGIEGPQAAELQKMGIFNFTQLHNLNLEDRAKLQNAFRQRSWRLDMDQWRIAPEGNTERPSIEDIQRKAFEIYQDRDRKGFSGGERTDWEQAEWELRGNPIFCYGAPHEIDDFATLLTGVTPEARDELYRMGLYNRHQLDHLGHDIRRMLTRWFAGPRFGIDLTQSFGWLGSMDSVPTDKDFGHVFAIRPTRVDDLSDINGIGGPTEHDLNRIGIYQFEQIAAWNADNVVAVNELLNLDGQIDQDQWVVQAQRLVRQR